MPTSTHAAVPASASRKVSTATELPDAPGVNSMAFNSAGMDGAFKTGVAVTATVTFRKSVTVDTTSGGRRSSRSRWAVRIRC